MAYKTYEIESRSVKMNLKVAKKNFMKIKKSGVAESDKNLIIAGACYKCFTGGIFWAFKKMPAFLPLGLMPQTF